MEARRYCWVTHSGWSHHHSLSPPTHQLWQLNNRLVVPSNAWRAKLQSRTHPSAWCTDVQSRTPARGAPLSPGKGPFKCLKRRSYGERQAKEAFWSPATTGSEKDSERTITSAADAVRVPAHLVPPGTPQAKQLCHLHTQLSLGQSCHRQNSCVYALGVALVISNSLQPCRLRPARLLCQGGSPGKNTGAYWPTLVAIPF